MSRSTATLRRGLTAASLALGLLLTGCASVYRVDSQVQSFPGWTPTGATAVPAAPQTYRFERLPSQREAAAATSQGMLEELTRAALAHAGWNLAEAGTAAPWTVQVSAGTLKLPRAPWEEPWDGFGTGIGLYGGHGYWGTSVFMRMDIPYYERQVSLVIRQGEVLGFVGTTGNAPKNLPHLHFQVMLYRGRGQYWGGDPINPHPYLARSGRKN